MISDSVSPSGIVHVMSAELCVMSEDVMREGGRGDIWGGCEGVRVGGCVGWGEGRGIEDWLYFHHILNIH